MTSDTPRLPRDAVERLYPLGPLQAGMLYHDLLAAGARPYLRQVSFSLRGAVEPALIEASWNALLERHPLMRSLFDHERTAQPVQIVLKVQTAEFDVIDVEGRDADGTIEAWCEADARRGFDLARDALTRVTLFRIAPERWRMVWSYPHILLDGWSGAVLMEEFACLYAAGRQRQSPRLPPAPDPDAFMAMRAMHDAEAARRHWTALLQGYDELATLPRLPRAARAPAPASHRFTLDCAQTVALRALAAENGATLSVLLQAVWGLVLGRWCGRHDVVFGLTVSGRTVATAGVERLVGMFINTVAVRVRWDADDNIAALLRRLQRQADDGIEHHGTPLADIQAASACPHGLLDHVFVLENYPSPDIVGDVGFTVEAIVTQERANYDFGLLIHAGATLDICLPYDGARLSEAQMVRLERYWRTAIDAVLSDRDRPLVEIDAMPAAEREALVGFAHGPVTSHASADGVAASLAALWRRQVDRAPDAPALVDGSEQLDYRSLDAAADGVAERLAASGVAPGDVVGILCERGAARISALLGIHKVGATYLPLSPALPDARLRFTMADASCRRVLVDSAGAVRLDLPPETAMPIEGPPGTSRMGRAAPPDSVAYIIYTSGSTGRPKGVAVTQAGFVNMILAQIRDFAIAADDRVLQFASCSFDAALSEIFMALLGGGCLVLAPSSAVADGAALLDLMARESVSVATLPPSYLRALDGAALASLRVLIMAGEAADPADARRYAACMLTYNAYGPSEASVCASWHRVRADATYDEGVPIGRPIANTAMHVLGDDGRPVPIGAVGEICLSGSGLAQGYVGQPALTAERFPTIGDVRTYRTGDLAIVRDDGEVLFRGRRDGQVKLNGHRIEPSEIEGRLCAEASIAQAAVVPAGEPPRLAAYVVTRGAIDLATLRQRLAEDLPSWMVPATITPVAALPRTLSGKIDRAALGRLIVTTAPTDAPLDRDEAINRDEALVADAFASVLGNGPYSGTSSFAASGGDSLRAIRLLGRLRRHGFALDLGDMLAADTVAAVARSGRRAAPTREPDAAGPVPLTPMQHWYFDADPEGAAKLNHVVLLRTVRRLDDEALGAALTAIWHHHDGLRLRFARVDGRWVANVSSTRLAHRSVDLTAETDAWAAMATDAKGHQPPAPLSGEILFRATIYRRRDADHLLLTAHHLLVDAASWRILIEDLGTALSQISSGLAVELPGRTTSLHAWSSALRGPDGIAAANRQRTYWDGVARAPLNPIRPVPTHGYDETKIVAAEIGAVEPACSNRRVLALLLAGLAMGMPYCFGREAMHVTLSHHGRTPLERTGDGGTLDASRTVGWLTADFPFLLEHGSTAAMLEAALVEVPSGGVSWGVLRWLSGDPVVLPDPQISLNYLGDIDGIGPEPESLFVHSDRLAAMHPSGLRRRRSVEIEAYREGQRLTLAIRHLPSACPDDAIQAMARAMTRPFDRSPHADEPSETGHDDTA